VAVAETKIPYVTAYGTIPKALEAIRKASTPDRFTQDFLATKLGLPGGSPKPVIPFLKRTGFLGSDGTPTSLYKRFRNNAESGKAAAEALRRGYQPLYEINEYVHDAKESDLKGIVVQATGAPDDSQLVKAVIGSFKALRAFANFDAADRSETDEETEDDLDGFDDESDIANRGLNLSYTINLHLPATSDIAVFNAIFKSLREHLLK
jgi:hypothetical protein